MARKITPSGYYGRACHLDGLCRQSIRLMGLVTKGERDPNWNPELLAKHRGRLRACELAIRRIVNKMQNDLMVIEKP